MRTLLIRVEPLVQEPRPGYPIRLYCDEGEGGEGGRDWWCRLLAEDRIPPRLQPPALPGLADGGEVDAERLRRALVGAHTRPEELQAIGHYLYELLAQGEVGRVWQELRSRYPREQPPGREGLRTFLDVAPPELRRLPWELLRQGPRPLFVDLANPCARVDAIDFAAAEEPELWPLRLLVVAGDLEDASLGAARELEAIRDALRAFRGRVEPEFLQEPSRQQLVEAYGDLRPHVFHFTGHSQPSPGSGEPVLVVKERKTGRRFELAREDVAAGLSAWSPHLVVLNACRTADAEVHAGAWSLADAFAEQGALAVLAMQGDIPADAAVTFSASLYRSLGEGAPLDRAVTQARHRVYQRREDGRDRRDWCLPCLTLSVLPERVLPMGYGVPEERSRQIEQAMEFDRLKTFVDRTSERRRVARGIDPDRDDTPAQDLMILVGDSQLGKTSVLRWCVRTCALRGRNLAYVDLKGERRKSFFDVLGTIRHRIVSSQLNNLTQEAFARFDRDFGGYLQRDRAEGGADVADRFRRGPEDGIPALFRAFGRALSEAAGGEPLILALDHVQGVVESDFSSYVCPYLIQPIAEHRLPPLRVIIALSRSEHEDPRIWPRELYASSQVVEIGRFPKEGFLPLVREFLLHNRIDLERAEPILQVYSESLPGSWEPRILTSMLEIVQPLMSREGS